MIHKIIRFFPTILLCLVTNMVLAEDVTLTSASGGLTVSGELLSYDGKTYQVETDLGRLTIADENLTCRGTGCPLPQDRLDVFSLIPSERVDHETIVAVLKSFAKDGKKIFTPKGPFTKPETVELAHRTQGLEAQIAFKSNAINLKFSTDESDTAIGFDAVQIISKSPTLNGQIQAATLRGIWNGTITNWSQLGGPDMKIRLILPIFTDDLYRTISRFDSQISEQNIAQDVEYFLSRDAIRQAINETTDTIGLIYQTSPIDTSIAIETACGIVNAPSTFAIQSMEYPLAFQINISANQNYLPDTAQRFKTYATTPPAQKMFSQVGIVPLVGTAINGGYHGKRFADAISNADRETSISALKSFSSFANNATRLATTLYMAPNGRDLDQRSTKLLAPLASLLKTDVYAGRKITAVGFSDSSGNAKGNLAVSKRRAEVVQAALADLGVTIETNGFGELAPIGCNTTEFGKNQNRHVELWIAD
jgi:phosphate transport system substrate-binding protein